MRWFAGTSGYPNAAPRPAGARAVWSGPDELWLVGDWTDDEVRTADRGPSRLAVIGECYATTTQLEVGLAVARGGGLRSLTDWPGSYHVVLRLGRRTVVTGDVAGLRRVYHARYADGTVFSSHALPLAALTGADLDGDLLAATLACPDVPELLTGRSLFAGVARVEPGRALELAADGQARTSRHDDEDSAPLDFAGAAQALRAALTEGVGRRVAAVDRIGADLSGGRDSTVLALLAARSAPRGVVAVTWSDPAAPDDVSAAARTAAHTASLRHLVLPTEPHTLPYAGLDAAPGTDFGGAPATDAPGPQLVAEAALTGRLQAARDAGAGTHLSGYGGEAVLGTPFAYLADLAQDRRRVAVLRHARAWAKLSGRNPQDIASAARRLGRTPFTQALVALAEAIAQPAGEVTPPAADTALTWCAPAPAADWVAAETRHRLAASLRRLSGEVDGAGHSGVVGDSPGQRRPGDRAVWVAVRRAADRQRVAEQLADRVGVRLRAPYLDTAVVRAATALPASGRERGDGPRALLEAATDGLVARDALVRAGQGDYTGTHLRGLRRHVTALRELLEAPLLERVGVLDAARVRRTLDLAVVSGLKGAASAETRAGGVSPAVVEALGEVVATELWVRQVVVGRMPAWERPNTVRVGAARVGGGSVRA